MPPNLKKKIYFWIHTFFILMSIPAESKIRTWEILFPKSKKFLLLMSNPRESRVATGQYYKAVKEWNKLLMTIPIKRE